LFFLLGFSSALHHLWRVSSGFSPAPARQSTKRVYLFAALQLEYYITTKLQAQVFF